MKTGTAASQTILLPEAELHYYEALFSKEESDRLFSSLLEHINWQQGEGTFFWKKALIPRLQAWYGETDESKIYKYSGMTLIPMDWTPDLLFIKNRVDELAGVHFTNALVNLYRDGRDGVGWHSDDESILGENPIIGSVSFGATRVFQLRHKTRGIRFELELKHGSFLLMQGPIQHYWQHRVPKKAGITRPRINVTFRVLR